MSECCRANFRRWPIPTLPVVLWSGARRVTVPSVTPPLNFFQTKELILICKKIKHPACQTQPLEATMNRPATIKTSRVSVDKLATLDLSDDLQRWLQELIRRTHTGRWPLWRGYAMRRHRDRLYELVEWVPRQKFVEAKRFNVITWIVTATSVGTTWQREHMTLREARALFAQMKRGAVGVIAYSTHRDRQIREDRDREIHAIVTARSTSS